MAGASTVLCAALGLSPAQHASHGPDPEFSLPTTAEGRAACGLVPITAQGAAGQPVARALSAAPCGSGRALASSGSPVLSLKGNVTAVVSEKELDEEEEGECWSSPFWHVPPATHSWMPTMDAH